MAAARAAGLSASPDRSRFVAEIARIMSEVPERLRQDPASKFRRLQAHLEIAGRLRRTLAAVEPLGAVSLARADDSRVREGLEDVLELVGLRLRAAGGKYSVEAADTQDARERLRLVVNLGIDASSLAGALNRGETISLRVPVEVVPVPLTPDVWSRAVFGRQVSAEDLFAAIVSDSRAALLGHGLAGLDDSTLQYLADHPSTIGRLYGHASVFAAFGSHLKVRDGRMVTPGEESGEGVVPLWEDLVGETVTEPERFVDGLFGISGGRLAYLYDMIGELDRPRAAFALSLWIKDAGVRKDRTRALALACASAFPEWPSSERPFARPTHDVAAMLMSVEVHADGSPRQPAARLLWSRAFAGDDLPGDAEQQLRGGESDGPIDAAWLAERIATSEANVRARRMDQLAFGYRMFGAADTRALGDVLVALLALPKYRSVMLALEQMGIRDPGVYAIVAHQAGQLSRLEDGRAFVALNQFQGALALVGRMSAVGRIDAGRAESLVTSLAAVPLNSDGRYASGVAAWLRRDVLGGGSDEGAEDAIVAALSGNPAEAVESVAWEGEQYRLDLAAGEQQRLRRIRQRQGGYSVDVALALESVARTLDDPSIDLAGVQASASALQIFRPAFAPKVEKRASDLVPGGAEDLPNPREVVDRSIEELAKITRPQERRRAARVAKGLLDLTDVVLGEVLSSLAYAVHLGDPDGPTLLGGDVARRHDFGVGSRSPVVRTRMPWSIPEQRFDTGMPRYVTGSLVGLDVALARLALRRVSTGGLAEPPTLGSNDRETFAQSVALLNPFSLRDTDRDTIAHAVARGRQRVAALETDVDTDALAEVIRMDGWRRRALRWTIAHEPEQTLSLFSMTELLVLGGGEISDLHSWGVAMTPVSGCLCTRLPAPNAWRFVTGRPQAGILSTAVPDLTLHVAVALSELGLPAALARTVLGAAMQDYVDVVKPIDPNDWLTLVRAGRAVSRERIEDYLAAAAAAGGPLRPANRASSDEP